MVSKSCIQGHFRFKRITKDHDQDFIDRIIINSNIFKKNIMFIIKV